MANLKSGSIFGTENTNAGTSGIFIGYGNKNNENPLDTSSISDTSWVLRWTVNEHTPDGMVYGNTVQFSDKTDDWDNPLDSGLHNVMLGADNHCDGTLCTLVGLNNNVSTGKSINTVIGLSNYCDGSNNLLIGSYNSTLGNNLIALGDDIHLNAYRGTSIGSSNSIKNSEEVAVLGCRLYLDGDEAGTTLGQSILLGFGNSQDSENDLYNPDKISNFTGFVNYSENITGSEKSGVVINGSGFSINKSSYIVGNDGYMEWFDYNAGNATENSDEIADLYNQLVYINGDTLNVINGNAAPIKKIGVVPYLPDMFSSVEQPDGVGGEVAITMNIGNSQKEMSLPGIVAGINFDEMDFVNGNYTTPNKIPVVLKGKVKMKSPVEVTDNDVGNYLQFLLYDTFNSDNCSIVSDIETTTDPWKYGHFKILAVPDVDNDIITVVL